MPKGSFGEKTKINNKGGGPPRLKIERKPVKTSLNHTKSPKSKQPDGDNLPVPSKSGKSHVAPKLPQSYLKLDKEQNRVFKRNIKAYPAAPILSKLEIPKEWLIYDFNDEERSEHSEHSSISASTPSETSIKSGDKVNSREVLRRNQKNAEAEKQKDENNARVEAEKKKNEQNARDEAEKIKNENNARVEAEKMKNEQNARDEAEKKRNEENARDEAEKKKNENNAKVEVEKNKVDIEEDEEEEEEDEEEVEEEEEEDEENEVESDHVDTSSPSDSKEFPIQRKPHTKHHHHPGKGTMSKTQTTNAISATQSKGATSVKETVSRGVESTPQDGNCSTCNNALPAINVKAKYYNPKCPDMPPQPQSPQTINGICSPPMCYLTPSGEYHCCPHSRHVDGCVYSSMSPRGKYLFDRCRTCRMHNYCKSIPARIKHDKVVKRWKECDRDNPPPTNKSALWYEALPLDELSPLAQCICPGLNDKTPTQPVQEEEHKEEHHHLLKRPKNVPRHKKAGRGGTDSFLVDKSAPTSENGSSSYSSIRDGSCSGGTSCLSWTTSGTSEYEVVHKTVVWNSEAEKPKDIPEDGKDTVIYLEGKTRPKQSLIMNLLSQYDARVEQEKQAAIKMQMSTMFKEPTTITKLHNM